MNANEEGSVIVATATAKNADGAFIRSSGIGYFHPFLPLQTMRKLMISLALMGTSYDLPWALMRLSDLEAEQEPRTDL